MFDEFRDDHLIVLWTEGQNFQKGKFYFFFLIQNETTLNPYDPAAYFFFVNKRRNKLRYIHFDGTNYTMKTYDKDKGTYKWDRNCPDLYKTADPDEIRRIISS